MTREEWDALMNDDGGRVCDECGKPVKEGMADECGLCCCEECFTKYMDERYGKGRWKDVEDDGCGGYYVYLNDEGEWEGTGIYYTVWED